MFIAKLYTRENFQDTLMNFNVMLLKRAIDSCFRLVKFKCVQDRTLFAFVFARAAIEPAIIGGDKLAKRGCRR